jgi:hypothetical protein
MASSRPRIPARKPFTSSPWRCRSCPPLAPLLPLAPHAAARARARLPRHAPPHVETSPPPPYSPEKGASLLERRNVAKVELTLSAAAKGDELTPGRTAGVRLARGQSAAAPQHLRRGAASSTDHSSSRWRTVSPRTNSSRRHPASLALP